MEFASVNPMIDQSRTVRRVKPFNKNITIAGFSILLVGGTFVVFGATCGSIILVALGSFILVGTAGCAALTLLRKQSPVLPIHV